MFHLNEAFYHQEMPARARRLFVKTFNRYHKLDGGDEDVALHMAKQAVDREYVKLNDRWIPKSAAEEIVRHDLDEDSLSEGELQSSKSKSTIMPFRRQRQSLSSRHTRKRRILEDAAPVLSDSYEHTDDDDDDDDNYDVEDAPPRNSTVLSDTDEENDNYGSGRTRMARVKRMPPYYSLKNKNVFK